MSKTSIEAPDLLRRTMSGPAMGARWSATVFVAEDVDVAALEAALAAAVEEVESQMSSWRPTSDVERLNRAPIGAWTAIPAHLFAVLERGLAIGRLSEGAFDIGVGDLVRAYGFGGGRRRPDGAAIAACAGRPPFEPPKTLELDPVDRRARRLAAMTIDLSGIAKGYGVDRLAEVARRFGVAAFLVGLDGELRAQGAKPDGRAWAIGQEKPGRAVRGLLGVVELTDAAIATSGTYRHVATVDGREVSHTMDPATGRPLDGDLAQVSVVAAACVDADAWATALMVLGRERGCALARRLGLTAFFVGTDGTRVATSGVSDPASRRDPSHPVSEIAEGGAPAPPRAAPAHPGAAGHHGLGPTLRRSGDERQTPFEVDAGAGGALRRLVAAHQGREFAAAGSAFETIDGHRVFLAPSRPHPGSGGSRRQTGSNAPTRLSSDRGDLGERTANSGSIIGMSD